MESRGIQKSWCNICYCRCLLWRWAHNLSHGTIEWRIGITSVVIILWYGICLTEAVSWQYPDTKTNPSRHFGEKPSVKLVWCSCRLCVVATKIMKLEVNCKGYERYRGYLQSSVSCIRMMNNWKQHWICITSKSSCFRFWSNWNPDATSK